MKTVQNKVMTLVTLGVAALALNGCGSGGQIVQSLDFSASQDSGHLLAGFDAKVNLDQGLLPDAKLPIYNPKNPVQLLGYIETNPDGTVSIRVDVTEATKLQTTDGTLLPNGRMIPITLPAGVEPIGIPVINSNSKVYVAVGSQNIMAGVAVTLLADNGSTSTDWIRILQSLPTNIFYPFQVNQNLKGTAGLFTGDKVGVGVFAVQTIGNAIPTLGLPSSKLSLAEAGGSKPTVSSSGEVFGVRTQYPTGMKAYRISRALKKVRATKLD
jgi:hypothetical protein